MAQTPRMMIVGAGGRVGRLLSRAFVLDDVPVTLTHHRRDLRVPGLPTLAWSPLESAAPLVDWCERHGSPRAMLVLAGATPPTGREVALNASLALACQEAARAAGIGRILLASSSAVYGRGLDVPWNEDDRVNPPSAYGRAKLAMERLCRGPDTCALRIGNVAGADALLLNPARPVTLDQFPDGTTPTRSYIGPRSLARVLVALEQAPQLPPVLNLGSPRPVEMADLARAAGLPVRLRPAPGTARARLVLDCGRLEKLVAFDDRESTAEDIIAQWAACKDDR